MQALCAREAASRVSLATMAMLLMLCRYVAGTQLTSILGWTRDTYHFLRYQFLALLLWIFDFLYAHSSHRHSFSRLFASPQRLKTCCGRNNSPPELQRAQLLFTSHFTPTGLRAACCSVPARIDRSWDILLESRRQQIYYEIANNCPHSWDSQHLLRPASDPLITTARHM